MNDSKPPETPKADTSATTPEPLPAGSPPKVLTVFAKGSTAEEIVEALQKLAREHTQKS